MPLHKIELAPTPSLDEAAQAALETHEFMHQLLAPRKLTAAFKSRVAMAVIAQVRRGADTFGKIRKALPEYDDRELKSGIRYAKWMPMLEAWLQAQAYYAPVPSTART